MKKNYFTLITVVITVMLTIALCLVATNIRHNVSSNSEGETIKETETKVEVDNAKINTAGVARKVLIPFTEEELEIMAQVLLGEANCVESEAERSMVVWTILNRYDAQLYGDTTVKEICTRPRQFAWDPNALVTERNYALVLDVVQRWGREKAGEEHVGRTLPSGCLYFLAASNPAAEEWHNTFYAYSNVVDGDIVEFGWSNPLENPYGN